MTVLYQVWCRRGIKDHLKPDMVLYADLPRMRASNTPQSTIPDSILATSTCPDIVIIEQKYITLTEQTISPS